MTEFFEIRYQTAEHEEKSHRQEVRLTDLRAHASEKSNCVSGLERTNRRILSNSERDTILLKCIADRAENGSFSKVAGP